MKLTRNNAHYQSISPQDRYSKDYIKNIFAVVTLSCVLVMSSLVVMYIPVQDVKAQDSDDCMTDTQDCYFEEDPGACSAEYPVPVVLENVIVMVVVLVIYVMTAIVIIRIAKRVLKDLTKNLILMIATSIHRIVRYMSVLIMHTCGLRDTDNQNR